MFGSPINASVCELKELTMEFMEARRATKSATAMMDETVPPFRKRSLWLKVDILELDY